MNRSVICAILLTLHASVLCDQIQKYDSDRWIYDDNLPARVGLTPKEYLTGDNVPVDEFDMFKDLPKYDYFDDDYLNYDYVNEANPFHIEDYRFLNLMDEAEDYEELDYYVNSNDKPKDDLIQDDLFGMDLVNDEAYVHEDVIKSVHLNSKYLNDYVQHDLAQDDLAQDDLTRDDYIQDDLTQDDLTKDDLTKDDSIQDDSIQDDSIQDDSIQDDSIQDDSIQDDSIQDDLTRDDSIQDDSPQDDLTQDEPIEGVVDLTKDELNRDDPFEEYPNEDYLKLDMKDNSMGDLRLVLNPRYDLTPIYPLLLNGLNEDYIINDYDFDIISNKIPNNERSFLDRLRLPQNKNFMRFDKDLGQVDIDLNNIEHQDFLGQTPKYGLVMLEHVQNAKDGSKSYDQYSDPSDHFYNQLTQDVYNKDADNYIFTNRVDLDSDLEDFIEQDIERSFELKLLNRIPDANSRLLVVVVPNEFNTNEDIQGLMSSIRNYYYSQEREDPSEYERRIRFLRLGLLISPLIITFGTLFLFVLCRMCQQDNKRKTTKAKKTEYEVLREV